MAHSHNNGQNNIFLCYFYFKLHVKITLQWQPSRFCSTRSPISLTGLTSGPEPLHLISTLSVVPEHVTLLLLVCLMLAVTTALTHRNWFTALWILHGTTWVSRYQKKHSPIHTYHSHQLSLICFINLI